MSDKKVHEVFGLTDFRFKLSETLKALEEGKDVKVHAFGLDRKPKGIIHLTYEKFESEG